MAERATGRRDTGKPGRCYGLRRPPLRDLAFAGDFEAVVTFGIGVSRRTGFRVLQLDAPSRVAIDITHTPPGTGTQLLQRGGRGAAVATWQWRLRLVRQTVEVDEDFGPATEAATRNFQQANGLTADGIVGPLSRSAMERSLGIWAESSSDPVRVCRPQRDIPTPAGHDTSQSSRRDRRGRCRGAGRRRQPGGMPLARTAPSVTA